MAAELFIQDLHPTVANPVAPRPSNLTDAAKLGQPNCLPDFAANYLLALGAGSA